MFFKLLLYSVIFASSYALFRYFYDKLMNDEEYLRHLADKSKDNEKEQLIQRILYFAREAELLNHFENACDYYFSLIRELHCEVENVFTYITSEETKQLLSDKLKN
ncbi:hypothetical protein H311_02797 [Anncaliia algerae PRA109]|nr:hypothetical protein H311_02804 [Anncaliia algerae PRA109]KCZ76211.1 hypothetical protein H311_02797 [Anncaliia algerae PRA109]